MPDSLNYGMVGGSLHSFIGNVHRIAVSFGNYASLTAGCFSTDATKNQISGDNLGLPLDRIYKDYQEMARKEGQRADGIDFVVIVTPNHAHYSAAKAFLENGIHVLCEKPLCFTIEEALELQRLAKERDLLFCTNYSYTGNVMVKEARELILSGKIGEVVNVNAEYLQDYLIGDADTDVPKQISGSWRKDPKYSGISNCIGDIGTHIENTVSYMTGLRVHKVAAMLDYFGQALDLNANILVELENGAHGTFAASQVCIGHKNGLAVRIFGTKGAIEWVQENPNVLLVTLKDQPTMIYQRGTGSLMPYASSMTRLPAGHPEGLYSAFANIYQVFTTAVRKKRDGEILKKEDFDFPTIEDGLHGVRFVHACVESNKNGSAWTKV